MDLLVLKVIMKISTLLATLPFVWMQAVALPMRHRTIFLTGQTLILTVVTILQVMESPIAPVIAPFSLLLRVVLPWFFWKRSLGVLPRIIITLAPIQGQILLEPICTMLWSFLTQGAPSLSYYEIQIHFSAFLTVRLASFVLGVLFAWGVIRLTHLWLHTSDVQEVSQDAQNTPRIFSQSAHMRDVSLFLPSVAAQFPSMFVLLAIYPSPLINRPEILVVASILAGTYVMLDILIARTFYQMREAARIEAHAEALSNLIDAELKEAQALEAETAKVSRMRHDMRNHLQVIHGLLDLDETKEAASYIQRLQESTKNESQNTEE